MAPAEDKSQAKLFLDFLKNRRYRLDYTDDQCVFEEDIDGVQDIWEQALAHLHARTDFSHENWGPNGPSFPFLDLPAELRNRIYEVYLEDHQAEPRHTRRKGFEQSEYRGRTPTHCQLKHEVAVQKCMDYVCETYLKKLKISGTGP